MLIRHRTRLLWTLLCYLPWPALLLDVLEITLCALVAASALISGRQVLLDGYLSMTGVAPAPLQRVGDCYVDIPTSARRGAGTPSERASMG